ncbi:hypothetical protein HN680_00965, partial [Candidatus Peregrinibacteria bacterium]|nr:hypothetical protein [Candidatus Peregrinibacteria bacterium]
MPEAQSASPEQSDSRPGLWQRAVHAVSQSVQRHNPHSEVNRTANRLVGVVKEIEDSQGELTAENGFGLRHSDADRTDFQDLVRERLLDCLLKKGVVPRSLEPINELGQNPPAELPHAEQVTAVHERIVARVKQLGAKGDDGLIAIDDINVVGIINELTRGSDKTELDSVATIAAARIFAQTEFEELSTDPP